MTQVNIISPINIGSPTFDKERKTERKIVQNVQEKTFKKNVQEKRSRESFKRIVQEKKKNVQEKRSRKTSECFKRSLLATNRTKHDQSSEPLLDDRTFLNHVRRAQRNLAFPTPRQHPQRNAQGEHDEQQPVPAPRKETKN